MVDICVCQSFIACRTLHVARCSLTAQFIVHSRFIAAHSVVCHQTLLRIKKMQSSLCCSQSMGIFLYLFLSNWLTATFPPAAVNDLQCALAFLAFLLVCIVVLRCLLFAFLIFAHVAHTRCMLISRLLATLCCCIAFMLLAYCFTVAALVNVVSFVVAL